MPSALYGDLERVKGGKKKMSSWGGWLALIGGVVSVIAQWAPGYWLALIGGVLAIIGAIGAMSR